MVLVYGGNIAGKTRRYRRWWPKGSITMLVTVVRTGQGVSCWEEIASLLTRAGPQNLVGNLEPGVVMHTYAGRCSPFNSITSRNPNVSVEK